MAFAQEHHDHVAGDFIEECVTFPNGAHDDQDAMTQALLRWHVVPRPKIARWEEPLRISPILKRDRQVASYYAVPIMRDRYVALTV